MWPEIKIRRKQMENIVSMISMTMGAAWASGINLYATILMLGIGGITGNIDLPAGLDVLENPMVLFVAGVMYIIEFFADKVPGVDSAWDTVHTFIRIPAGALLAYSAVGDVSPSMGIAAGIVCGGVTATTHTAKAGTRAVINTSPEPFTNIFASIGEDVLVVAGLWTALNHPWIFLLLLTLFMALMVWLLPRIWKSVKKIFSFIFGKKRDGVSHNKFGPTVTKRTSEEEKLEKLKNLFEKDLISKEEYEASKKEILENM